MEWGEEQEQVAKAKVVENSTVKKSTEENGECSIVERLNYLSRSGRR